MIYKCSGVANFVLSNDHKKKLQHCILYLPSKSSKMCTPVFSKEHSRRHYATGKTQIIIYVLLTPSFEAIVSAQISAKSLPSTPK